MEIAELINKWQEVSRQRKELDALSKKLKEGPEAELKAQVLMYLSAQGLDGIKTERGTVTRISKTHLEIVDLEKFLGKQFNAFLKAVHDTRPFADELYMQKTPHKTYITELVRKELGLSDVDELTDEAFNAKAAEFGIKRVSEPDLSIKTK